MPEVHARLSASSSHRWLNCTPSVALEEQYKKETTEYAEEGTLAHSFGELRLRKELGEITTRKFNAELKKLKASELYKEEMDAYVDFYVNTVMEKISEAKVIDKYAAVSIEKRLDFSEYVPQGFGTGDAVIIADGVIEICDLKYGMGVKVDATENPQLMLYALGALNEFGFAYEPEEIKMTIIQPRLDHVSEYTIRVPDLLKWAEEYVKPRAELAMAGKGEYKAGEHCQFCRAKYNCRARAEENLKLAKYEFQDPDVLSLQEIADIVTRADHFTKWLKDVQVFALESALEGDKIPGYKLILSNSKRRWSNEELAGKILVENGFQENIIWRKSLDTITNIEKALGKKKTQELLGDCIIKPEGKPKLALESDKHEEYIPGGEFKEEKLC